MLSARDGARVLARAQATGTCLVLIGDVAQLGSVEAGRAFGQFQEAGMATYVLDEIVRQTNAKTRERSRPCSQATRPQRSPNSIGGGGRVVEQPDSDARVTRIAEDFVKLSP